MSNRKSFKVSEEEYKQIQFINNVTEENKQLNRLDTIKGNDRRIKHFERLIEDKKDQIKSGSREKNENYLDGKKPVFMLENELEEIEAQIEQLQVITKATQEEYDKHAEASD